MATFIKVTNLRKGEVNVHTPPLSFPPGDSYHKPEVFEDLQKNHRNVIDALRMHENARELLFEPIEVTGNEVPAPPAYKSGLLPFMPEPEPVELKPELPASGVPPLSSDEGEALLQIANQTNAAVLDAWFDLRPPPVISDAIMNKAASL